MPCKRCPYALLDANMKIGCHADDPAVSGKYGPTACGEFPDESNKKGE